MRTAALAVFALALPAAAQTPPDLFERAKTTWHRCLLGAVPKFDDGVSPASEIAQGMAVAGACSVEYDVMFVHMGGLTDEDRRRSLTEQRRIVITRQSAMPLVLQHRAAKRP